MVTWRTDTLSEVRRPTQVHLADVAWVKGILMPDPLIFKGKAKNIVILMTFHDSENIGNELTF